MKLPQFQQGGKPPVKRKVRCRLNLARIARAGNEALATNLTEPKANMIDSDVSDWLARRPNDKAMIALARAKLREFAIGDSVRFSSPLSPTVLEGRVTACNGKSVTIFWERTFSGTFTVGRTWGWDCLEKDRRGSGECT
jgi:hypothetical protein